jgi:regulator of RNase E activity RraB
LEHAMPIDFPEDSDGDALRRVVRDGSDMAKPMFIDFHVAMPSQEAANRLADRARRLGYHASVFASEECRLPWTCQCSTRMLATYEGVLSVQHELAALSAPLDGFTDGWGTFGNGPNGQPSVAVSSSAPPPSHDPRDNPEEAPSKGLATS